MSRPEPDDRPLAERVVAGDRRAVARLISLVEDGSPEAGPALEAIFPHTGRAYVTGVTGVPGSGKSTLTDALVRRIRAEGQRVAVLAVDPSSPFTGGAVLGDRVRMQSHAGDPGVFVRSMATRGHLGGLALATPEAVRVLDAAGADHVLIETVGVGQAEVEVAGTADTTVVVVNPGWGDAVQAAKAGLLEIADVFLVNKADRPGVAAAVRQLEQMLDLGPHTAWRPPVLQTVATEGTGVEEAWQAIGVHRVHLESSGELAVRRRARIAREITEKIAGGVAARVRHEAAEALEALVARVAGGELSPRSAAATLLATLGHGA